MDETKTTPGQGLRISSTPGFAEWLRGLYLSLLFTTYQASRIFAVGLTPSGRLAVTERLFMRSMGLYVADPSLFLATRFQIWRFENVLEAGGNYENYDRLYVPRTSHTTGDLDIHDLAVDSRGRPVFINTRFSCLASLSRRDSFVPIWKPPFISKLFPEDRCHLNGLAMADGEPAFVTAVGRSDEREGWRNNRRSGGLVMDVRTGETVATGLSMPHSPRIYQGRLWVLNAGSGEFGYVDESAGKFQPVAFCPGFLRGLDFFGNHAIVGLSRMRPGRTFSDLALDRNLADRGMKPICGLMVIDINSGNILHWLEIEGVVSELYDVRILPFVRRAMILGMKSDEVKRIISIEPSRDFEKVLESRFMVLRFEKEEDEPIRETDHQLLVHEDLTMAQARDFEEVSFPSLNRRWYAQPPAGQLTAAAIVVDGSPAASAMSEFRVEKNSAEVTSLFVSKNHRRRGWGTALLAALEEALTNRGCRRMYIDFRSDWPGNEALEKILAVRGWSPSRPTKVLFKTSTEKYRNLGWPTRSTLTAEYEFFRWANLSEEERREIVSSQRKAPWFPEGLSPFQRADAMEASNSLGLRFDGRVIGWAITHRTAPDTIHTTALFVHPDHGGKGLSDALLAESIKKRVESGIPYGTFSVDARNKQVLDFVQRRLEPYLVYRAELRRSVKVLVGSEGDISGPEPAEDAIPMLL